MFSYLTWFVSELELLTSIVSYLNHYSHILYVVVQLFLSFTFRGAYQSRAYLGSGRWSNMHVMWKGEEVIE